MQSRIGRFELIKVLGKGSQGIVYLAKDPVLERQVAIKTIDTKLSSNNEGLSALLMDEAKVISKMSHPNIVSIYEAGEEGQMSYLVFEYIKGYTLSEIIKSKKYQAIDKAIPLFEAICLGMQHSHEQQIIHGDLKPANIIIDVNGIPKIMDFGIARLLSNQTSSDNLYGTPRYMSPEYLKDREVSNANDVYALGLILYELLTAQVAIAGNNINQIVYNVFNTKIKLPSESTINKKSEVNELFEHVVLKATEKQRIDRFNSMSEILDAIGRYKDKNKLVNSSTKSEHAAITFLMRKIKRQEDFPALSATLIKVNSLVDSDNSRSSELSSVIAEDFALTNKILKLVNSAYYRGSKPEIKTLSQAVLMLGFEEVRTVSMSLILIEHLHNKAKAKKIKDHIVSSIYSGILAKDLSLELNTSEPEESFLSGIFHQLGELLTLFYFHEEAEEVNQLISEKGLSKEQASTQIMGVSYQKLGIAIAKEWKLPYYIINDLSPYKVDKKLSQKAKSKQVLNDDDQRRAITTLSNELSDALEDKHNVNWRKAAVGVWREYTDILNLDDDALKKMAERARENLLEVNHIFKINLHESEVLSKIDLINNPSEEDLHNTDETLTIDDSGSHLEFTFADITKKINPVKVLGHTLTEVQSELNGENNLSLILKLIMDGFYKAFALERIVICFYDKKSGKMSAKMGKGLSENAIQLFNFSLNNASNLFQVSCLKGVDIFINNTLEFEEQNRLPSWYRQIIDAKTLMMFPIMLGEKPFAMIYLDNNRENDLIIGQKHLKKLQVLRGLVVESIHKKCK